MVTLLTVRTVTRSRAKTAHFRMSRSCRSSSLTPGQAGVLRRVGTNDARVLRYLSQLTLEPGQALRLVDLAPFGGPVTLELLNGANGDEPIATKILGSELAAQLFIRPHTAELNLELGASISKQLNAEPNA